MNDIKNKYFFFFVIEKKFLKELRSELKPLGFSNKFINEIAGW